MHQCNHSIASWRGFFHLVCSCYHSALLLVVRQEMRLRSLVCDQRILVQTFKKKDTAFAGKLPSHQWCEGRGGIKRKARAANPARPEQHTIRIHPLLRQESSKCFYPVIQSSMVWLAATVKKVHIPKNVNVGWKHRFDLELLLWGSRALSVIIKPGGHLAEPGLKNYQPGPLMCAKPSKCRVVSTVTLQLPRERLRTLVPCAVWKCGTALKRATFPKTAHACFAKHY